MPQTADCGARISQCRTARPGELPSKSGQRANAGGVARPEILAVKPRAGAHRADHVVSNTEPLKELVD